jgi:hypothetical protein
MITRDEALNASEFHAEGGCTKSVGPRGGVTTHMEIWRVKGSPKTWKRKDDVRVPVKYGMYDYGYVNWPDDRYHWHTRESCPLLIKQLLTEHVAHPHYA